MIHGLVYKMHRRGFITGLAMALVTAPSIVRASSLMPVKVMLSEHDLVTVGWNEKYPNATRIWKGYPDLSGYEIYEKVNGVWTQVRNHLFGSEYPGARLRYQTPMVADISWANPVEGVLSNEIAPFYPTPCDSRGLTFPLVSDLRVEGDPFYIENSSNT